MSLPQEIPDNIRRSLLQHLTRRHRVAHRLRHLLALKRDHAVVHPETSEPIAGSLRLSHLVLMVRETQIQAATVDIERLTQVLARHRRALDVPARTAAAPRRNPRGRQRIAILMALPHSEVTRIALTARIGVAGVLHVIDRLMRQATVGRVRTDIEIHVARTVLSRIRVPRIDQPLDEREHLGHVAGRARLIRRRQNTQRRIRLTERRLKTVGQREPLLISHIIRAQLIRIRERERRLLQNLVIDIRDVTDHRDVETAVREPAAQNVERNSRTHMPHMRHTLNRRATVIQPHVPLSYRDEIVDGTGTGVIKTQAHELNPICSGSDTPTRRREPKCPRRRLQSPNHPRSTPQQLPERPRLPTKPGSLPRDA